MSGDDEGCVPAWVTCEAEEPDSVSTLLYLDEIESIAAVRDILRLWHDTAGGALLTAAVPEGWTRPRTWSPTPRTSPTVRCPAVSCRAGSIPTGQG